MPHLGLCLCYWPWILRTQEDMGGQPPSLTSADLPYLSKHRLTPCHAVLGCQLPEFWWAANLQLAKLFSHLLLFSLFSTSPSLLTANINQRRRVPSFTNSCLLSSPEKQFHVINFVYLSCIYYRRVPRQEHSTVGHAPCLPALTWASSEFLVVTAITLHYPGHTS